MHHARESYVPNANTRITHEYLLEGVYANETRDPAGWDDEQLVKS